MRQNWLQHRLWHGARQGLFGALGLALIVAGMFASTQTAWASGWSSTNSLPLPLQHQMAFTDGAYLYIVGGLDNVFQFATYSAQVSTTGTLGPWRTLPSIPQALLNRGAVEQNGYAVIMGGWNTNGVQSAVYSAQLQSGGGLGSWTATTSLPQPLWDLSA